MNRNGHSPTANGNAAAASPIERKPRRRALRAQRFRPFRQPAIANDAGGEESLAALRAELLVLREENIRLKSPPATSEPDLGAAARERARAAERRCRRATSPTRQRRCSPTGS